jgi:osmotically-inducible protein OsmY
MEETMTADSDIKRYVEEEIRSTPDFDSSDIAVAVKNGIVTLTGFARSYGQKLLAEKAAKRVHGVVGVANDIEIRLPGIDGKPDPEIARDAVAAIKSYLPLAGEQVKVVVKGGWVTLEGEVEWNYQRESAEKAVRWVKGVKGVTNLIALKSKVAPTEIQRKIEEAFRRNAEIDAKRITVETRGGEVILSGAVRSWAERQEAERVAWTLPGVTKVENRITISP